MSGLLAGAVKAVSLPSRDTAAARESSAAIAEFVASDERRLTVRFLDQKTGEQLDADVPLAAIRLLAAALSQMADGHSVTLVPLDAELSTQQAADLLRVSRPYFVKLLEERKIPFRKVGEHRRVRCNDLLAYIKTYQDEAAAALDEMASEAQRAGFYE